MASDLDVKPVAIADWDESLASIVEDMGGRPLNVHSLMAHNPALLKAWWDFRNYSVQGGALGRRRGELLILRVAVRLKTWYEWGSHVERSLACGLSMAEIERVKLGVGAAGWEEWDEAESVLLQSVDELLETQGLKPSSHSALREHFSVSEIMDIIAIHGMYVILGGMINTWGLELDAHIKNKLPDGVTEEKFEADAT
ncbi:MAG: carboxymuconolactone decarboxylase family protein [Woeseiaceae bacterium]